MSTLALSVDEALRVLDPEKRAELERVVYKAIERLTAGSVKPSPPARQVTQEEWQKFVRETAGSLPDFPEDFEESPWETNREPLR